MRNLLAFSIAFNMFAEMAFTGYLTVNDFINLSGHFFKIVAVYLIYEAIIVTGLLRPYSLLFRELAQREEAQRASETRERPGPCRWRPLWMWCRPLCGLPMIPARAM